MAAIDTGQGGSGRGGRWFLALFGLPFAAAGIGVLGWLALPMVMDWQAMQSWNPVQAELLSASLEAHRDSDSSTYRATARYRYEYGGNTWENDRVAISGGSDNIGDFQQRVGESLESAYAQHQPVTVYVNPLDPQQSVINRELRGGFLAMVTGFGSVFALVGLGLIGYAFFGKTGETGVADPAQPWRAREEWHSPEIRSGGKGGALFAWFFAIIWCGISGIATVAVMQDANVPLPALLGIGLFDVIGAGLMAWAVHATISAYKFGELVLRLDPHPGSIGGDVGGMIDLPVPYEASRAVPITLSCVHVYTRRSGNKSETQRDALFSDTRQFLGEPSGTGTRVHFSFPVPAGLPDSTTGSDRKEWAIDIDCELPGVDLSRRFEVPVFAGAAGPVKTRVASKVRESTEASLARLETLMNLTQVPGGIAMDFRAGRSWKAALGALLFGGLFSAVPVFVLNDASAGFINKLIFGGLFGLIGLGAIAFAVWLAGNARRVQLDADGLFVASALFGVPVGETRESRARLSGIAARRSGSVSSGSQVTVYYELVVRLVDNTDVVIGDGFAGYGEAQRAAETLAGFTGLPFLGERARPRPAWLDRVSPPR